MDLFVSIPLDTPGPLCVAVRAVLKRWLIRQQFFFLLGCRRSRTLRRARQLPVPVASARIFGTRIGNYGHGRTGNKLLRRKAKGPALADWYRKPLASQKLVRSCAVLVFVLWRADERRFSRTRAPTAAVRRSGRDDAHQPRRAQGEAARAQAGRWRSAGTQKEVNTKWPSHQKNRCLSLETRTCRVSSLQKDPHFVVAVQEAKGRAVAGKRRQIVLKVDRLGGQPVGELLAVLGDVGVVRETAVRDAGNLHRRHIVQIHRGVVRSRRIGSDVGRDEERRVEARRARRTLARLDRLEHRRRHRNFLVAGVFARNVLEELHERALDRLVGRRAVDRRSHPARRDVLANLNGSICLLQFDISMG